MKPNDIAAARTVPPAGGGFRDPIWTSRYFVVTKRPRAIGLYGLHEIETGHGPPVTEPDERLNREHESCAGGPAEDEIKPVHLLIPRYVVAERADHRARNGEKAADQDQELAEARAKGA